MSMDVEHLFTCLLAICTSLLGKISIQVFSPFIDWVVVVVFFFLILSCMSSVCILDINPLWAVSFANIFSHSIVFLFRSKSVVSMFSSRSCMVSGLTFSSLIHLN